MGTNRLERREYSKSWQTDKADPDPRVHTEGSTSIMKPTSRYARHHCTIRSTTLPYRSRFGISSSRGSGSYFSGSRRHHLQRCAIRLIYRRWCRFSLERISTLGHTICHEILWNTLYRSWPCRHCLSASARFYLYRYGRCGKYSPPAGGIVGPLALLCRTARDEASNKEETIVSYIRSSRTALVRCSLPSRIKTTGTSSPISHS